MSNSRFGGQKCPPSQSPVTVPRAFARGPRGPLLAALLLLLCAASALAQTNSQTRKMTDILRGKEHPAAQASRLRLPTDTLPVRKLLPAENCIVVREMVVENVDINNRPLTNLSGTYAGTTLRYLRPVLTVKSRVSEPSKTKLFYRIVRPDGNTIVRNIVTSPKGYTTSAEIDIDPDTETITLGGWGDNNKSMYRQPGTYTIELFSQSGKLLKRTELEVSSGVEISETHPAPMTGNGGDKLGVKIMLTGSATGYKGEKLSREVLFYCGEDELLQTSFLTPDTDRLEWENDWSWISYDELDSKFGASRRSEIKYEVTIRDAEGTPLATKEGKNLR